MSQPKQLATLGPPPKQVDVIFVAKYDQDPNISSSEVSTAIFLAHAKKQEAASLALKPSVTTRIFEVRTLGDIRKGLLDATKSGDVVQRVDILAHGNGNVVGLTGVTTADNVNFLVDTAIFDQATVLYPMADWTAAGFADSAGEFIQAKGVGGWQDAVLMCLTDDATINVFACNSGGEDTNQPFPKTITREGVLLTGIAKLFGRSAVGFGAYLLWLVSPSTSANLYTFLLGIPISGIFFANAVHGRAQQSPTNVPFYRDLVNVKRIDFPAVPLIVKRSP